MVESRYGACLLVETLERCCIVVEQIGKEFQSNRAAQPDVFGLVHDTDTARTELIQYPVMGNGLTIKVRGRFLERLRNACGFVSACRLNFADKTVPGSR